MGNPSLFSMARTILVPGSSSLIGSEAGVYFAGLDDTPHGVDHQ